MARHTTRHGDVDLQNQQNNLADLQENPVFQEAIAKLKAKLLPKDFVKLDTSFPPYWKCQVGEGFRGKVLMRDERNPDFVRYHIKNTGPEPLECRRGPVGDGVVESVAPGRIFTISEYKSLRLDRLFGFEVVVMCMGEQDLPGNEDSKGVPRTMFVFDSYVDEQVEKQLESQRMEDLHFIAEAQRDAMREAITEITKIGMQERIKKNNGRGIPLGI